MFDFVLSDEDGSSENEGGDEFDEFMIPDTPESERNSKNLQEPIYNNNPPPPKNSSTEDLLKRLTDDKPADEPLKLPKMRFLSPMKLEKPSESSSDVSSPITKEQETKPKPKGLLSATLLHDSMNNSPPQQASPKKSDRLLPSLPPPTQPVNPTSPPKNNRLSQSKLNQLLTFSESSIDQVEEQYKPPQKPDSPLDFEIPKMIPNYIEDIPTPKETSPKIPLAHKEIEPPSLPIKTNFDDDLPLPPKIEKKEADDDFFIELPEVNEDEPEPTKKTLKNDDDLDFEDDFICDSPVKPPPKPAPKVVTKPKVDPRPPPKKIPNPPPKIQSVKPAPAKPIQSSYAPPKRPNPPQQKPAPQNINNNIPKKQIPPQRHPQRAPVAKAPSRSSSVQPKKPTSKIAQPIKKKNDFNEKIEFDEDFIIESPTPEAKEEQAKKFEEMMKNRDDKPINQPKKKVDDFIDDFEDDFIESSRSQQNFQMITETKNVVVGEKQAPKPKPKPKPKPSSASVELIKKERLPKVSKKPVYNSERLPKNLPFVIGESITKEAMDNLGLVIEDIYYPSESDLNAYSRDPDIRETVRRELQAGVDKLVEEIEEEIIKIKTNPKKEEERISRDKSPQAVIQNDEKMYIRQKKEIENLILQVLKQRYMVQEQTRREQLEQARRQVEEEERRLKQKIDREQRQKKLEELEKKEKERERQVREQQMQEAIQNEQMKKRIEAQIEEKKREAKQKEEERKQKIEQVKTKQAKLERQKLKEQERLLQELAEKEEKRLKLIEEERIRKQQENDEEKERKAQILKQIKRKERRRARALEYEAEEKQRKIQEALDAIEQKKQEDIANHKQKFIEKQEHAKTIRQILENQTEQNQKEIELKQKLAEQIIKNQELERQQKAILAKMNYSDNSLKMKAKRERQRQIEKEKMSKLEEEQKQREKKMKEAREKVEFERNAKIAQEQIKRKMRQLEAQRQSRKNQIEQERTKKKMEKEMKEFESLVEEKKKQQNQRKKESIIVTTEKKKVHENLSKLLQSDNVENQVLQELAEKYNIDLDALQSKAENPREETGIPRLSNEIDTE